MEFLGLVVAMVIGLPLYTLLLVWSLDRVIPLKKGTAFYAIGLTGLFFSAIVFLITNPIFFPSEEAIMSLKRLAAIQVFFAISMSFMLAGRKKDIKAARSKS